MKHLLILAIVFFVTVPMVHADEQITYVSQPEEVAIFLNNIAYIRDLITIAGDTDIQIVLPNEIYQDTLIVRDNEQRVPTYRINRNTGQVILSLPASPDTRTITLEYLLSGMSWKPTYNMWLTSDNTESVQFEFFVEIQNTTLSLDDVQTKLVAGRVDTSQQLDTVSTVTANQYAAGYAEPSPVNTVAPGAVTVQHVYEIENISAEPGDTIYSSLLQTEFPARQLFLWNAQTDLQATVIYKVSNNSEIPLAEGIVRSYQDGLFVGSDFIEVTPVGSEGSVTVGGLQDLRVNRTESQSRIDSTQFENEFDTKHEVTLTLSNFSSRPIEVEVLDVWNPYAYDFTFSLEPEFSADNFLRWTVTIPAGESFTITYEFVVD